MFSSYSYYVYPGCGDLATCIILISYIYIQGVGTFHYNSIQDKNMQDYLANPLVRRRLLQCGAVSS